LEIKKAKNIAHFCFLGYKILKFRVLELHTIFGVFSDKIFFCSEFSSFEGVNWGFLEGVCQKFSKKCPLLTSPESPLLPSPLGEE
jgi:hypothetical protein